MNILITRPEPGASATAARIKEQGHTPILLPCLTITPRPSNLPKSPAAIIITSSQAIHALPDSYHRRPIFSVGDATAARLREAGFTNILSASGDAADLYRLIAGHSLPGLHLLAAGAGHGLPLATQLRAANIKILRRAVYTAHPIKTLPPEIAAALANAKINAALFYSAESVRAFTRLHPPGTRTITAIALSQAIAAPLQGLPWNEIRVALTPTEADLLALLK